MKSKYSLAICLTFLLAIVILALTLTPISVPSGHGVTDKTFHAIAFAALTLPIATFQPRWLWFSIPIFILFGGAIEIIQPYFGRSCDFADWIADIKGVLIGSVIGLLLNTLLRMQSARYTARKKPA